MCQRPSAGTTPQLHNIVIDMALRSERVWRRSPEECGHHLAMTALDFVALSLH